MNFSSGNPNNPSWQWTGVHFTTSKIHVSNNFGLPEGRVWCIWCISPVWENRNQLQRRRVLRVWSCALRILSQSQQSQFDIQWNPKRIDSVRPAVTSDELDDGQIMTDAIVKHRSRILSNHPVFLDFVPDVSRCHHSLGSETRKSKDSCLRFNVHRFSVISVVGKSDVQMFDFQ